MSANLFVEDVVLFSFASFCLSCCAPRGPEAGLRKDKLTPRSAIGSYPSPIRHQQVSLFLGKKSIM